MIGRTLDRYRIDQKLGEGGMGVVYKAATRTSIAPSPSRSFPRESRRSGRKQRFVQEAKAASALNHPNIVTIHDIRSEDGVDFIVMEYAKAGRSTR